VYSYEENESKEIPVGLHKAVDRAVIDEVNGLEEEGKFVVTGGVYELYPALFLIRHIQK
jgi:hypothetical protein